MMTFWGGDLRRGETALKRFGGVGESCELCRKSEFFQDLRKTWEHNRRKLQTAEAELEEGRNEVASLSAQIEKLEDVAEQQGAHLRKLIEQRNECLRLLREAQRADNPVTPGGKLSSCENELKRAAGAATTRPKSSISRRENRKIRLIPKGMIAWRGVGAAAWRYGGGESTKAPVAAPPGWCFYNRCFKETYTQLHAVRQKQREVDHALDLQGIELRHQRNKLKRLQEYAAERRAEIQSMANELQTCQADQEQLTTKLTACEQSLRLKAASRALTLFKS